MAILVIVLRIQKQTVVILKLQSVPSLTKHQCFLNIYSYVPYQYWWLPVSTFLTCHTIVWCI